MTTPEIILAFLVAAGAALGVGIVNRIRRLVDAARIRERDGLRELTSGERIAFARHLADQRGPCFRPLFLGGIVVVLICGLILWRLGFIGH